MKAFEWGTRHPKEATLNAIIGALGLTREQANPLREANGYAEDWWAILHDRFLPGALDLQAEVDRCPWPAFVANQSIDIIHSNEPMARILRADSTRDLLEREERNLLSQVSNRRFVDLFANFDEVVTFMIGTVKGDPRWQQSLGNPSPWMKSRIEMFLAGDREYVARVFKLWSEAPPLPQRARHTYPVRIYHPSGDVMRFRASASIADLWNELTWQEWVPEDAETWLLLNDLMAIGRVCRPRTGPLSYSRSLRQRAAHRRTAARADMLFLMRYLFGIVVLCLTALAACGGDDSSVPPELKGVCSDGPTASAGSATIESPKANDEVSSPLRVKGAITAEGPVFFAIVAADGSHIADYPGRAASDSSTAVPFEQTVPFGVEQKTNACLWITIGQGDPVARLPITLLSVPTPSS